MTTRLLIRFAATAATLSVFGPAALSAQQPGDTVRLREIVVTATRLPTPLAATTQAVTVLSGVDLRARGIRTIADALRTVPGADVVETGPRGGATSLFLRGGESNMVRVLLDGVPLNQPGGAVDLANLTTDDVERIEIVRGPASVLYGSDAVAGVVQIFTRGARGSPRWEAAAGGGTFGSRHLDLRLATGGPGEAGGAGGAGGAGATSAADASLGFAHEATDGIYPFNNAYRSDVVAASAGLAPGGSTTARLAARYTNALYHYPTDGSGNLRYHNQFQSGSGVAASLDLGRYVAPGLETRLLLALTENTGRQDQEPNGPADTLGFYAFWSLDRVSRRSADVRLNWYATPAAVVTAGAALETEAERSSNASRSQFGPSAGSLVVSRWNRAWYAQAVADAGTHVSFTGGLRLEHNQAFGSFLTYRAGVTWRWGGTRLRAALGNAFKEPGFLDNYGTGYVTGNPNLKPERSRGWDAGLEQQLLGGRLAVSATWFDQRFRDLIQYTFTPPTPTSPNYYNVAAADAYGLELEARAVPAAPVAVTARYTWTHTASADSGFDGATFAQGRRLLRRPTGAASLDLVWQFGARASASATAQYVGDRDDEDFSTFPGTRVILPSYVRLDVAGEAVLLAGRDGRRLAATLKVENLLDARYEQVLHFPARRRALYLGLRLEGGI